MKFSLNRRVIVLLETSLVVSRDLLEGIVRYTREHDPWILELTSGGVGDLRMPQGWTGDGIISRALVPQQMRNLLANPAPKVLMDTPAVSQDVCVENLNTVRFESDYYQTGCDAADYFLARGFRHFAFVEEARSSLGTTVWQTDACRASDWSIQRGRGFCERLAACGHQAAWINSPHTRRVAENWHLELPHIVKRLQNLPKPLAIFAPNDSRGRQILDACQVAGIPVPYSVAVLGVNDDRVLCETSHPPLSSIPLCAEEAGYAAAAALDGLMRGERSVDKTVVYGHRPVVTRDSTLSLQTDDPLVIAALRRIRETNGFCLRVTDLALGLETTVRNLENHFTRALGQSVGSVLRETCFSNIRRLVVSTDLPFKDIAVRSGQLSVAHLADAYRRRFGCTMGEDRKGVSQKR
ncbi:MAG: substrate-binding domain-containing protein [bacterium]|nr:substrate-binding domain-containing protein [bacterium]